MDNTATTIVRTAKIYLLATVLLSAGCGPYAVTVNQQEVYSPPPLFADFSVQDPALKQCLQQAIRDQKVRAADELTQLICTYAGLTSLAGLEVFSELQQINLNHNQLQSIEPLPALPALTELRIDHNPALACEELEALSDRVNRVVPEHCRANET